MATVLLALVGLFVASAFIDIIFGWSLVDWIDKKMPKQTPLKYEGEPRYGDPIWEDEEFIRRKVATKKHKSHKKLKESLNAALKESKSGIKPFIE